MKKLFLLLLVAFLSSCTTKHFSFNGIEMGGSLDSFRQQLENKGFSFIETLQCPEDFKYKNVSFTYKSVMSKFSGTFVGVPADIFVHATPNSSKVFAVHVIFKCSGDETSTYKDKIFHMLMDKYPNATDNLIQYGVFDFDEGDIKIELKSDIEYHDEDEVKIKTLYMLYRDFPTLETYVDESNQNYNDKRKDRINSNKEYDQL